MSLNPAKSEVPGVSKDLLFVGNRSAMLSIAAGGGGAANNEGANYTHGESFYTSTNGPTAVYDLQLTYANYALGPDEHTKLVNNPIVIEAAIAVADGDPVRVTFGPEASERVTIPMEAQVISNVVRVEVPSNAKFTVRTGVYVKPGQTWPVGFSNYNRGDNAVASHDPTSHVMSPYAGVPKPKFGVVNQLGYAPISIVGRYVHPEIAVASLGDSLTTGNTGRGNGNHDGDRGTLPYGYAAALSGRVAYSKLARDSAFLMAFKDPLKSSARIDQLAYSTHVVVWLGTNDVGANSLDALKSCLSYVWAEARKQNRLVIAVTLPPRTTGISRTTLAATQLPRKGWEPGGKRDLLNGWIKAQVGAQVDGVLDFNSVWESRNTPGTWIERFTSDGTHPNEAGMQAVRSLVGRAADAWRRDYAILERADPSFTSRHSRQPKKGDRAR